MFYHCRLILLGFFFILLLLPGCGSDTSNRILVWTTLRPIERDFLQQKLDAFAERYPDYEFRQLYYEPEELRTNFIISSLAGKGPALIHSASDNIGPMSELEVIRPLDTDFSEAFLDSFLSEPFAANTWHNGHLYQIADRVGNHLCLVYNKDMIAEAPRTMSELITVGQQIVDRNQDRGQGDTYALAWNYIEPFFAIPFIGGYGGWVFDENGNPNLNTQGVAKAAQLIYDLAWKYQIIPKECDYETANALFLDGRSAMIINGPWSWSTYDRNLNIGLAKIPMIDETGKWPAPMVSPVGYMVNVNLEGERLKISLELLRFLTGEDAQVNMARKFNLIPSRKLAMKDSTLNQDAFFQVAVDQMMVGRPMPVVTELRWIWDAMRPAYQAIFSGRLKPEAAAAAMQKEAVKLIEANR